MDAKDANGRQKRQISITTLVADESYGAKTQLPY